MSLLLWKLKARLAGPGIARDVAGAGNARRALVRYLVVPFQAERVPISHQNVVQVRTLARAIGARGYAVDVLDHAERSGRALRGAYDLVVDIDPRAHASYEGHLAPGAPRVYYATGCNPSFSNAQERERLEGVRRRRGHALAPRRHVAPHDAEVIGACDAAMVFGAHVPDTYRGFRFPPHHLLPNHGYDVAPTDPARRDPRRFLFLGGTGQVHKGLDLLLELFAVTPALSLVVCSPYLKERDFVRAYDRELFHAPNIRAAGWVDVLSPAFRELQAECGAVVLPSCAEGQSGSITAAMSFGLPAIVSRWCGFDEPELTVLPDDTPETLAAAVQAHAARPASWVVERSHAALALVARRYRPEHFAAAVGAALDAIVGAPA